MGKTDRYFERIKELKERFRKRPTEWLRYHVAFMGKEGSVAVRQVLEEREDHSSSN